MDTIVDLVEEPERKVQDGPGPQYDLPTKMISIGQKA